MPVVTSFEAQEERFIATAIELGLTFAQIARTEYSFGDEQGGVVAQARAAQTCAGVERRVTAAEARGRLHDNLRARLRLLHDALEGVAWHARKVA